MCIRDRATAGPGDSAPQSDGDGSARQDGGRDDGRRSPRLDRSGSQQDDPRSRPAPSVSRAGADDDPGYDFPPAYDDDSDDSDDSDDDD